MSTPLRVRILGTGAMACWLGGLLARDATTRVTLAGTWSEALARLARDGIQWRGARESFQARVEALPLDGPLPLADVVVVLVKAHQSARVASHAWRALASDAAVLSLQNGLGAREALCAAPASDAARIAVGVATVGARLNAPAVVEVGGDARVVIERVACATAVLEALVERLRAAGVEAACVANVRPHVWRKLIANCAINALGALHGVPNGALLERADLRADFEAAAREAGAVARALGVDPGADPVELAVAVARATADNRSSMLQDVERGAPTEIEALHGAVLREARRLGLHAPTLEAQWQALRPKSAAQGARPGCA